MTTIGVPELTILIMLGVLWVIPVLAAIWALVTLYRIRAEQHTVQVKLDAIERLLSRPS